MGLHLDSVEIRNYRGLGNYKINGLSNWVALTGPNSSNKSSLISAISILGSNKMHDLADIPANIKKGTRNVPICVIYTFKFDQSFEGLINDDRLQNFLLTNKLYEAERRKKPGKAADDYAQSLDKEIYNLKEKTLRRSFYDALYDVLKRFLARGIDPSYYNHFLFAKYGIKPVEEVLKSAQYLKIDLSMTISDGPNYELSLLDADKQPIVDEYLFNHWIHKTGITNTLEFPFALGAVFIKCIQNRPLYDEENSLPPIIFASDSSNLEEYIKHCLECNPEIIEKVSENFEEVFGFGVSFKKPQPTDFSESTKILVKIKKSDWFPLERLSDGMLSAFKILLQLNSCKEGDILVIDEPELHLHPGAAKTIRDLLYAKKNNIQIITSTHSPIFINPSYVDSIVLHRQNKEPNVIPSNQIDEALIALGSSGSDVLLYDIVIWYEGPSDKIYLEKLLQLYAREIKTRQSNIGLMHFGGGALKYINPETIKKIACNSIFVIDSDKEDEKHNLEGKKQQFIEECRKSEIKYWVTTRREIENYIPIEILRDLAKDPSLEVKGYDDVMTKLNRKEKAGAKVRLAIESTRQMTLALVQKDAEFDKEFKASIIDVINSFT
jgi:predicted ATP-dependent endonuclease of OLD family